jgi:hypothetical protein
VRDQIEAIELTGWSASGRGGGRAPTGVSESRCGGGRSLVGASESGHTWCRGCRRIGERWLKRRPEDERAENGGHVEKHWKPGGACGQRPGHGGDSRWAASVGRLSDLSENGGVSHRRATAWG